MTFRAKPTHRAAVIAFAAAPVEHRCVFDSSSLLGHHGLLLIFGNVLVNQIGLPIPAFPTLVIAGCLCQGAIALAAVFAVALTACVIADVAWYLAGRAYGERALKMLCRMSMQPESCLEETRQRFARRNASFLFFARFIPGVDQIAVPLAGSLGIAWRPFMIFNTAGAVVWLAAGLGLGVCFKSQAQALLAVIADVGAVLTIVAAVVIAYFGIRWYRRRGGRK